MHPPALLPYTDLTDSQWQLLAELVTAPLPGTVVEGGAAGDMVARGLDPGLVSADLPILIWLKYAEQRDTWLAATDLGAAVHYRARCESLQLLLSDIARLAADHASSSDSAFAHTVRQLAQGDAATSGR